jgi:hypothetical protein
MPTLPTLAALGLLLSAGAVAGTAAEPDRWAELRFLIGDWAGEGQAGQGTGEFSLAPDLQGKVLVRRGRADLPAAGQRPAGHHEDLMVIHRDGADGPIKAVYFDNEGHVIHYSATISKDGQTVTFVSEAAASEPRFRLTYRKGKEDTVAVKFEIAPPGKPDVFLPYLEGTARRKAEPKR